MLSNASDLDGDSLTVTGVSDTSHGAGSVGTSLAGTYGHLTLDANGSYSYVADNTAAIRSAPTGTHLQDAFTYTVSDGNGGTATASLTVTLDRAPVVTASNVTLTTAHAVAASSLFSATDPDGNAITTYAFEDTGSGHFILNSVVEPNNQEIDVSAAQLSQLTYQSVAGSVDTLEVRVNDGTLWSNWQSFTVTPAVVIQIDGTTTLALAGNNYFLDVTGSGTLGPELTAGRRWRSGPAPSRRSAPCRLRAAVMTSPGRWSAARRSRSGASTAMATSSPISATICRARARRWRTSRPSSARTSTATAPSGRRLLRRQRP